MRRIGVLAACAAPKPWYTMHSKSGRRLRWLNFPSSSRLLVIPPSLVHIGLLHIDLGDREIILHSIINIRISLRCSIKIDCRNPLLQALARACVLIGLKVVSTICGSSEDDTAVRLMMLECCSEISIEELLIKYHKSFDNVPLAGLLKSRLQVEG
ncbi:hypothetical protein GOBAR_AA21345 [Gossypium barbadense]|uniref:Uncharacterized protein n=1 Tax=Gossypium barbadense TaxID=3634 RepID=A0A2P5X7K5_GOSBA|nr:hypothetical protein GOBAR_AA21345 [Gossypium barbadense]